MVKTKKGASTEALKSGKVEYKYIPRRVFGIENKNHILYDGKLDSSIDYFPPRKAQNGKYKLNASQLEIDWIEEHLGLDKGTLNPHLRDNPYLDNLLIEVPKGGLRLNLNDPYDYLVDTILTSYDNVFARGLKDKDSKRSYRYVRIVESEETDLILEVADQRKDAYRALGAIESSRNKMIMILLNSGKRLNPVISTKELRRKVNEMVEENYGKFNRDIKDPMFEVKGLLNMAVITGAVTVNRGLYFFNQEPLAFKDEPSSFDNAVIYVGDKTNSTLKMAISKDTLDEFNRD